MKDELYISLLQKKLSGSLSHSEQADLDDWLRQSADNQLVASQVERAWNASGSFQQDVELDADADFERLERRIAQAEATGEAKVVSMKPRRNWLAVAAAVVLLISAPLVLRQFLKAGGDMKMAVTDAKPSERPIELADGSKVWLNSRSTLRYFTGTDGEERRVELLGEGFFEVAKNPEKPFVVQTTLGEVTVLGTSFNVRNQPSSTTLEVNVRTGRVRLQPTGAAQMLELVANETGVFDEVKNTLTKATGTANNTAAWHTRQLVFDNTPVSEVLRQMSAAYGVSLSTENSTVRQCPVTLTFEAVPLDQALETLGTLLGLEVVKVSEEEYRLRGGRCQ